MKTKQELLQVTQVLSAEVKGLQAAQADVHAALTALPKAADDTQT